ncbi:hypothetical protein HQ945_08545 [Phyllobacterium sp. BT25]|uniref:HTH cro/C1-type domain-containing protein n=1 Tax=Phyllobacterium pellucidum TaxID=2740464 RepID=A0A849VTY0_9HYPH|nr:hypothetical protein [Phyllobacterium pellucidum]
MTKDCLKALFPYTKGSGKLPTYQGEISDFTKYVEISYCREIMDLKTIVVNRLEQLGVGAVEAATAAGIERTFIRDIVDGKKKSVRADKMGALARALKLNPEALMQGELLADDEPVDHASYVRLMGFIGAGAVIEPDFEQTPPEGLDQIHIEIPLPGDMIAFQVKGVSMLPRYDEGDVIIVWREQKRGTDSFLGEEAAVRTRDGRRFLKTIRRGENGYTLESWNDHPIENQELDWVGEIYVTIRGNQLRRMVKSMHRQGGVQGQLKLRA